MYFILTVAVCLSSCLCRFGFHSLVHWGETALLQQRGPGQSLAAVCLPRPSAPGQPNCSLQDLWLQAPLARWVQTTLWWNLIPSYSKWLNTSAACGCFPLSSMHLDNHQPDTLYSKWDACHVHLMGIGYFQIYLGVKKWNFILFIKGFFCNVLMKVVMKVVTSKYVFCFLSFCKMCWWALYWACRLPACVTGSTTHRCRTSTATGPYVTGKAYRPHRSASWLTQIIYCLYKLDWTELTPFSKGTTISDGCRVWTRTFMIGMRKMLNVTFKSIAYCFHFIGAIYNYVFSCYVFFGWRKNSVIIFSNVLITRIS